MLNLAPSSSNNGLKSFIRRWTFFHLSLLIFAYLSLVFFTWPSIEKLWEAWVFFPIGIFGAIVANSTGTGGGVVFVPAFAEFKINTQQAVGMSFLIQSFGMSIGALIWLNVFYARENKPQLERLSAHSTFSIIAIVLATCLPSLLITQWAYFQMADQKNLLLGFKIFSITLGIILLFLTIIRNPLAPKKIRREASPFDNLLLAMIGVCGGIVTALFSVGVGEFLAIYLIFRRFPTISAIVCAVVVSIVSVLTGVWYHIFNSMFTPQIVDATASSVVASTRWEIVILAIPGAIIGGFLAGLFASFLGTQKLKIFASLWIILSAIYLLIQGTTM